MSWLLGARKYHKVTLHNLTQEIYWDGHKVAAPTWVRRREELSRRQAYIGFLEEFSRVISEICI